MSARSSAPEAGHGARRALWASASGVTSRIHSAPAIMRLLLVLAFFLAAAAPRAQPVDSTAWLTPADWGMYMREATQDQLLRSAAALGLTPLSDVSLPAGSTEIRLWTGRGIFAPDDLARIVGSDGGAMGEMRNIWSAPPPDSVSGERPGETFHDGMVDWLRGQCDDVRRVDEIGSCTVQFVQAPDWADLLRRVASLEPDMFASPQPVRVDCPPDMICLDHSAVYTLEVRSGARHRAFSFRAGEAEAGRDGRPSAPVVAADSAFGLVLRALRPIMQKPDGELPYRGVFTVSHRDESTLTVCGSDESWAVPGSRPSPLDGVASGESVLVDGTGYLLPRWRSEQAGEPRRMIWLGSVSSVEPWGGAPCEGP